MFYDGFCIRSGCAFTMGNMTLLTLMTIRHTAHSKRAPWRGRGNLCKQAYLQVIYFILHIYISSWLAPEQILEGSGPEHSNTIQPIICEQCHIPDIILIPQFLLIQMNFEDKSIWFVVIHSYRLNLNLYDVFIWQLIWSF